MTTIQIHRLATGTEITIPGYDAVEVLECDFDGSGYSITVCTNPRYGWDAVDHLYVEAGGSVEHAGFGRRYERPAEAVTFEEWEALNTVALARLDASLADTPVNLLDAVQAHRELTASQATITDMICAAVYAVALDTVREGSDQLVGVAAE